MPPTGHRWPCVGFYITSTEHVRCTCPEVTGPDLAEATGYRDTVCGHLVHECRCGSRAETTTATTEDAARVINEVLGGDMDNHARIAAHRLADAGLLATARTRPTREQIAAVIHHDGWEVPEGYAGSIQPDACTTCRKSLAIADRILALLEGGDPR